MLSATTLTCNFVRYNKNYSEVETLSRNVYMLFLVVLEYITYPTAGKLYYCASYYTALVLVHCIVHCISPRRQKISTTSDE